jgi:hypothetical protein
MKTSMLIDSYNNNTVNLFSILTQYKEGIYV